jgi:hypothetical protein
MIELPPFARCPLIRAMFCRVGVPAMSQMKFVPAASGPAAGRPPTIAFAKEPMEDGMEKTSDDLSAALAAAVMAMNFELVDGLIRAGALSNRQAAEIIGRMSVALDIVAEQPQTLPAQRGALQGLKEQIEAWGISVLSRGMHPAPPRKPS